MIDDLNFNNLSRQTLANVGRQCTIDTNDGPERGEIVAALMAIAIECNGAQIVAIANTDEQLEAFGASINDAIAQRMEGRVQ